MFVVFDLDGTMADIKHRLFTIETKKQDWDSFRALCHQDEPIRQIIQVCQAMYKAYHYVEIWSGRAEKTRDLTEAWLEAHNVPYHALRLRPGDDDRRDVDVKEGWLRAEPCSIDLVFDDRKRLVEMWRRNGVRCCQVAEGDY